MTRLRMSSSYVAMAAAIIMVAVASFHAYRINSTFEKRELRKSTLATWIDNSRSVAILTDDRGFIIDWNPAATNLFQWTRQEMIGTNISILMPDEIAHAHEQYFKDGTDAQLLTVHCWVVKKDRTSIRVHIAIRTSYDPEGRRLYGLLIDENHRMISTEIPEPFETAPASREIDPDIRKQRLP